MSKDELKPKHKHASIHKLLKIILAVVITVAVIVGIVIGFDYINYTNGNRSMFFGTLDRYKQNQTLKFGSLNLKVDSVALKAYPLPTPPPDCSKLTPQIANGGRIAWNVADCQFSQGLYLKNVAHAKSKNELIVTIQYSNVADQALNLSDFKLNLTADTTLDSNDNDSSPCSGMRQAQFLKGYTETECISMDIDKGYSGPLALSVARGGKEKDISLAVPTVVTK
jgi:hypothetical protein